MKKKIKNLKSSFIQKSKSPFVRSLGVYTTLNFFLRGISFIITPLFTHYISPEEFGKLNIYLNSINFIAPIVQLGICNSLSVDYFKEKMESLSERISTYMIFALGITIFLSILSLIFGSALTVFFQFSIWLIFLVPIICYFNLITDSLFVFLRNENKVRDITAITIIKTVLEIILSILFIILLHKSSQGRIWSMMISTSIISLFCIAFLIRHYHLRLKFNFKKIKSEYRFWISTMIGFFFVLSFTVFDKYIVKEYCSPLELGNYSLSSQFGFIILTFSSALSSAYLPNLYRDLSQKSDLNHVLKKVIFVILGIAFVALMSNIIVFLTYKYFINSSYSGSWRYYLYMSISYGLWAIITIFYGFLYYFKMEKIIFYLGISSIVFFLPFQIYAIQNFGISGLIASHVIYFFICLGLIINFVYKRVIVEYHQ